MKDPAAPSVDQGAAAEPAQAAAQRGNALWRAMAGPSAPRDQAAAWAELLWQQLEEEPGIEILAVAGMRFDPVSHRITPLGLHPAKRAATPLMIQTAQHAGEQGQPSARGALPSAQTPADKPMCAAVPTIIDGDVKGVVCAEFRAEGEAQMRRAMRRLQWGAAWLRDQLRTEWAEAQADRYQAAVDALNAVVSVAEREDFITAAGAAVTDLATRFSCVRVSLGLRRWRHCRVQAISHSAQFSRRMKLVQLLCAAMDEAVDQRVAVLYPEPDDGAAIATQKARALARDDNAGHVLTVPLYAVDKFIGALVFERSEDNPFTPRDLEILEAVATVMAPILEEKRRNDRLLLTKGIEVSGNQLRRLLGPSHLIRKLVFAALIGLGIFFWYAEAPFEVSADAQVTGTIERSIVPSFDGYIAAAPVRAGEMVAKGDLLVQLDDRDLLLERQRLVTQRQRQQIEFDRAVAARDRAETSIRQTLVEQADAEIALLDKQLARTQLLAPFSGMVLSGDLSQSIGSAVSRGQQLLLLAPADAYRVKLQVDERQIADMAAGQEGALRVTALPTETFPIRIEKITPVATHEEGRTTFEVEAVFLQEAARLRPGMEGAARVKIDDRRLIVIWTKPMMDWARVALWRWWPV